MGKLTDLQKIEIVEKYLSGTSGYKLATEYSVRCQSIESLLRRRGVVLRRSKYNVDESYFDNIDTWIKAYWLGYLFAEGSLDTKRYTLSVKIGTIDQKQLHDFRDAIKSNHPIKPAGDRNAVVIKIGSKKICERLKFFQFGSGKAVNIRMPDLQDDFIHHFIRGFFDGDGWLSQAPNGNWILGFASCSKPLLESFQTWFTETIGIKRGSIICRKRSHIPNQNDNFRLQYAGMASPLNVLNILYKDCDGLALQRKQEIVSKALAFQVDS